MPNKKELDAEYWKSRRARLRTAALPPPTDPAVLPSEDQAEYAERQGDDRCPSRLGAFA